MQSHFFAMISRMQYINRWGLMRNTVQENIQQHSHMVAVLAHGLAVIENQQFGGNIDTGKVTLVALYHDASEILTGDMPTPIKYYSPDIQQAYKKVEQVAEGKLLAMLPEGLRPQYEDIICCEDDKIHQIVKAADRLSAYIKCIEELKAGNLEFKKAKEQTYDALCHSELKSLHYFMEHFLDSFTLTLDEQT